MSALAPTLEAFFTQRLINEKGVSPHTITAYRDTFRLLLLFTQKAHRQSRRASSSSRISTRR